MRTQRFFDYWIVRKSTEIMNCLKSAEKPISVEEIISEVTGVETLDYDLPLYCSAMEVFLRANKDIHMNSEKKWYYNEFSKDLKPVQGAMVIRNVNEYIHSVSYIERVKGFLKIKTDLLNQVELSFPENLEVSFEGYNYEFKSKLTGDSLIIYGNGVMDFCSDTNLKPGQKVKFFSENNRINVFVVREGDLNYTIPNSELIQIEESIEKESTKSAYSVLYELLSTYPEGLTIQELYKFCLDIKLITIYDLKNILKQNDCFIYDVAEESWKIKVERISRYYIDEIGNQTENEISYSWIFGSHYIFTDENEAVDEIDVVEEIAENPSGKIDVTSIIDYFKESQSLTKLFESEVNNAVKEAFLNGEIDTLKEHYSQVKMIENYFNSMENLILKWGDNVKS